MSLSPFFNRHMGVYVVNYAGTARSTVAVASWKIEIHHLLVTYEVPGNVYAADRERKKCRQLLGVWTENRFSFQPNLTEIWNSSERTKAAERGGGRGGSITSCRTELPYHHTSRQEK